MSLAIIIGLIVGKFIKKATIGLLIGLVLGLLAASLISGKEKSKKMINEDIPDDKEPVPFSNIGEHGMYSSGFLVFLIIFFYLFTKQFS